MELKTKLKRLLRQQGLLQRELAADLGMSRQNFSNKIAANSFSNDQLEKMAKILQVPANYFMDESKIAVPEPISENVLLEIKMLKKEKEYLETIIQEMKSRMKSMEEFLEYLKTQKNTE
jgi:transcriptional regulator with XRE-family HTH domain